MPEGGQWEASTLELLGSDAAIWLERPPTAKLLSEGQWANQHRLPRPAFLAAMVLILQPGDPGPQWPAASHVCMLLPQPLGKAQSTRLELTERGRQTRVISDHSVSTFQVLLPDAESMQAEKLELPLCSPSGPEKTGRHGGPVGPS